MGILSMLEMARGNEPPKESPSRNKRAQTASANPNPAPQGHSANSAQVAGSKSLATKSQPKLYERTSSLQRSNSLHGLSKPMPASGTPLRTSSPGSGAGRSRGQAAAKSTPKPASRLLSEESASLKTPAPSSSGPVGGISKKKLSFKDVMKQAESIDKSKLEMNLRTRDSRKKQDTPPSTTPRRSRLSPLSTQPESVAGRTPPLSSGRRHSSQGSVRTPAPAAQPFPEVLERKRARAAQRKGQEDSDLSDFVVSEDDEGIDGYDRGEIWRAVGRGGPRRYAEYESDDDMEATGGDIFDEERRSMAVARREDQEEERKLERLAREKELRRKSSRT